MDDEESSVKQETSKDVKEVGENFLGIIFLI